MADAQAQEPSASIEIVIGASYPGIITFDDPDDPLPAPLGDIAAAIRFELRAEPGDAPFYVATLGSEIMITGDTTASLMIPASDTANFARMRGHFEAWIEYINGEVYRTDYGVANIVGNPSS